MTNKTELIANRLKKAEISKKDVEKTVNVFVSGVRKIVKSGDKISLVGFLYHRNESVIV